MGGSGIGFSVELLSIQGDGFIVGVAWMREGGRWVLSLAFFKVRLAIGFGKS